MSQLGLDSVRQLQASDSAISAPHSVVAVFAWPASALVVTAGFLVAIVAFAVVIGTTLREADHHHWRRRFLGIIGVVLSVTTVIGGVVLRGTRPGEGILGALLGFRDLPQGPTFTVTMNFLVTIAIYLMVGACCVLCSHIKGEGEARRQELARRGQFLSLVIYISAINLTVAVMQVYWLFGLPQDVLTLDVVAGRLHEIAAGIAAIHGAYFTVLLIGVAGPTAFVLRSEARRLVAGIAPQIKLAPQDAWLLEHGLGPATGWKQLARIGALLAPLITGLIGGPLGQAFSALTE